MTFANVLQIVKIRADIEGIPIEEECLMKLAEIGVTTTLRYFLYL